MTQHVEKLIRCKSCGKYGSNKSKLTLDRDEAIYGTSYRITCVRCGKEGPLAYTPRSAKEQWNLNNEEVV